MLSPILMGITYPIWGFAKGPSSYRGFGPCCSANAGLLSGAALARLVVIGPTWLLGCSAAGRYLPLPDRFFGVFLAALPRRLGGFFQFVTVSRRQ